MTRILCAISISVLVLGAAWATPQADRQANCEAIGGVYNEGATDSFNTATCTVTTTDTVISTEQVNNIRAAKQVLRTTSTEITYVTVYAFTNPGGGSAVTGGVDGDPEVGDTIMVMCTPGSGYDACPAD